MSRPISFLVIFLLCFTLQAQINVKWFGADPKQSPERNRQAFLSAIDAAGKGVVIIPEGFYALSDSILITSDVTLMGDEVGGYPYYTSRLWFPQNKSGIVFKGANYPQIKNLEIYNQGHFNDENNDTTKHGVYSNTRMYMENVRVTGFSGSGIYVTTKDGGNANLSQFNRVVAHDNWQHGFHVEGQDANDMVFIGCSGEANRLDNFHDASWFGNTYIGIHCSDASYMIGNKSRVIYNGNAYIAKRNNIGIEPTNKYYWTDIGPGSPDFIYKTWSSDSLYRGSSPFRATGGVAKNTIIGSYTEQYQAGVILNQKSMWIGGDVASLVGDDYTPLLLTDEYNWKFQGLGLYQFPKHPWTGYMGFESEWGLHIGTDADGGINWRAMQGKGYSSIHRWHDSAYILMGFTTATYPKKNMGWDLSDADPIRAFVPSLGFRDPDNHNKVRSIVMGARLPEAGAPYGIGDLLILNTADTNIIGYRVVNQVAGKETWVALKTGNSSTLPKMTKAQRNLIKATEGQSIYQTDNRPGLRVYNGIRWMRYLEIGD